MLEQKVRQVHHRVDNAKQMTIMYLLSQATHIICCFNEFIPFLPIHSAVPQ